MGNSVKLERRDSVAIVSLNRPEVLNAVNMEMRETFQKAGKEVKHTVEMKAADGNWFTMVENTCKRRSTFDLPVLPWVGPSTKRATHRLRFFLHLEQDPGAGNPGTRIRSGSSARRARG